MPQPAVSHSNHGKNHNCSSNQVSWQKIYRRLELNKFNNVTTYQVNGNLYIVVPIEET